ncbi:hypothetical protein CORC01_06956 [Colletotrichum orchidophilum]|uniref:Uncharacterized protein n=1 Tax=Colletotrichum orchidophilum TaxID=1209926 RepID=A0A1G4B8J5_9PEZI|nr:uncharacterized protein CORC01_06956 [Colletotrichum orchidophilum]OHE97751.1 hypothetical protein CORC01_06956 [Colletotrichum orchidophilum]
MEHRNASTPRQVAWEKNRGGEEDNDDDMNLTLEEASQSLLSAHNTKPSHQKHQQTQPNHHRRRFTATYTRLALLLGASLLLGAALSALITTALATRIRALHASHRNDNTLASSSSSSSSSAKDDPSTRPVSYLQQAPCGSTPTQARAAGCEFDLISFNWLPSQCHDAALAATFEAELVEAGQLAWFEDANRTRPSLTREQIMTGEYTGVYVSLGYHLRHCTAMWKRMHRALMQSQGGNGGGGGGGGGLERVDSYIWSYHHTRHCEEVLLTRYAEADVGEVFTTEVRIKYPDCGVVLGPAD